MPQAPYCKVVYKTCRNPACGRIFVVVTALGTLCNECHRCRRDGYCSQRCRFDALAKPVTIASAPVAAKRKSPAKPAGPAASKSPARRQPSS